MMHPSDIAATRREFLLHGGVFAAGALSTGCLAAARQQSQGKPPEQSARQESAQNGPGEAAPQAAPVPVETIAHAERLAGIEFTPNERALISKSVGEQIGIFAKRRKHPFFPNTLAPATRFDPRPAGFEFPAVRGRASQVDREPAALPDDDVDIAFAPVTDLAGWLQRRQLTSSRLTAIYIERLKRLDGQLKCVITLMEDQALRQAGRADEEIAAGAYRGPLHGIPWGAKDLLDTAGVRTTWGAEPFVERVPHADAEVVRRLNDAGAVLIAKLSLGALAYNDIWFGGRTNNPWNLEQGSSGSSAGSAAATAAGLVGFSLGTETYGSIVSPCMRCGTTGLRPTFGRVSRAGAMALCWSLDKIGPICRRVEDCALVLSAINGFDASDPSSIGAPLSFDAHRRAAGLRMGFDPAWFEKSKERQLDGQALEAARLIGLEPVEIEIPDWPYDVLLSILLAEAAASFEELTRTGQDDDLRWQDADAWPNTFRRSWFIPAIELVQADRFRRRCMMMMADLFSRVDVILSPSFAGDGSLLLVTNNTGHPSLTVRCGFRDKGQPHGITLIGKLFDEGTLCGVGIELERALDVWRRRPAMAE